MALALAFAIPFFIQIFWDAFILGRPYFVGTGDIVQSYIGLGFTLVDGEIPGAFPAPGGFVQNVARVALALAGGSPENFQSLYGFTLALHSFVVIGCAWALLKTFKRLKLNPLQVGSLSLFFAAFPGMALFSTTLSIYYVCALLSFSAFLVLFERVSSDDLNEKNIWIPIATLGFVSANSYLFAFNFIVPALLLFAALLFLKNRLKTADGFLARMNATVLWSTALLIGWWTPSPKSKTIVFALLILPIGFGFLKKTYWTSFYQTMRGCIGPFMFGWVIGAGHLVREWWLVLQGSSAIYGDSKQTSIFMSRLQMFVSSFKTIDFAWILKTYPYFLISIASVGISLFIISKRKDRMANLWIIATLLVGSFLPWIATGNIFSESSALYVDSPWRWAIASRYFFPVGIAAALAFAFLAKNRIACGVSVVLYLLTLGHYHRSMSPLVAEAADLETRTTAFLRDTEHRVFCGRVTYPEVCSDSYSRSYYRPNASYDRNPRNTLKQTRVIEVNSLAHSPCDFKFQTLEHCFAARLKGISPTPGTVWIATEDRNENPPPKNATRIWKGPLSQISIYEYAYKTNK